MIDETSPKAPSAFANLLGVFVEPGETFAALAARPTWVLAFVLTAILAVVGAILGHAATVQASVGMLQHGFATNSLYANIPDAQRQQMLHDTAHPSMAKTVMGYAFAAIIMPLIAIFFNALILLIANAIGGGKARFATLWSGSSYIAFATLGLGALILGVIETMRGPAAFGTMQSIVASIPSLAWFAPGASGPLFFFLASLSIFALYGIFLNATMMRRLAGVGPAIAWIFPILIALLGAAFASLGGIFA